MRSWLGSAVELRLGKISRRLAQDLVGLPELPVLALQRLQAIDHIGRSTRSLAAVDLSLLDPLIERLWRAADLGGNRYDRCPPRRMLDLVIQNHSHRSGANLRRKFVCRFARHGSTFSGVGASDQPGAVHTIYVSFPLQCRMCRNR